MNNQSGHFTNCRPFKMQFLDKMCSTRLAGNAGRKKSPKIRHLATIAQRCRTVSSQLRHVSTIGKNLLNSITSSTGPDNMANFGLLTAEIRWRVWASLQISTSFASWQRYCTALQQCASTKLCGVVSSRDRAAIPSDIGQSKCLVLLNS